ncbi:MAG: hypothetical protein Q9226_001442 [Calogaya cf. arnoldii]
MSSVSPCSTHFLRTNPEKHGVPRTSGPKATGQGREKELQKIQEYRALVDTVNTKIHQRQYTNDVLGMTTRLLETNPEYYTIWNYRRLLLRSFFENATPSTSGTEDSSNKYSTVQQYITDDLAFLLPLLRKFPKCYWIWNYRLWLLAEATRLLPSPIVYQLWQKELGLVGKMLTLDSRNFHGWGYRRQVVSALEQLSVAMGSTTTSMTEDEFAYTTKMIESNLSNFSAWHRRSRLIPRLLSERNASHGERREFLDEDLALVQRALWADPDSKDQSLWFYHQYLISNFKSGSPQDASIILGLSNEDKLAYLKAQIDDLLEMLDGAETCKWIYQRLVELSLMSKSLNDRWPVEISDLEKWINKLLELDPLRKGRWQDLRKQILP